MFVAIVGCAPKDAPPPPIVVTEVDEGVAPLPAFDATRIVDTLVIEPDIAELRNHSLLIPVAGVQWPELRDTFNEKRGERGHNALDIMAPRGTPVLSADDGKLLKMHNSVPGGLTAYASDPGERFIYLYGHLDSYHPSLREGAALRRGDTIGFVGSTGNAAAAGPHLHFAIARSDDMSQWWKGTPLDPRAALR